FGVAFEVDGRVGALRDDFPAALTGGVQGGARQGGGDAAAADRGGDAGVHDGHGAVAQDVVQLAELAVDDGFKAGLGFAMRDVAHGWVLPCWRRMARMAVSCASRVALSSAMERWPACAATPWISLRCNAGVSSGWPRSSHQVWTGPSRWSRKCASPP